MYWDDMFLPLSVYNAEVSRGILHTREYKEKMKVMQDDFIERQTEWAKSKGWIVY